jgi:hypothetical protein
LDGTGKALASDIRVAPHYHQPVTKTLRTIIAAVLALAEALYGAEVEVSVAPRAVVRDPQNGTEFPMFAGPASGPLRRLKDGSLLLSGSDKSLRSIDGGMSWSEAPAIRGLLLERNDGSYYLLQGKAEYYLTYGLTNIGDKPGHFRSRAMYVKNLAELGAVTEADWKSIDLTVGQAATFTDNAGHDISAPFISGPLLELNNGGWLAITYGKFVGDTAPIPGFAAKGTEKWYKSRTYLLSSLDRGRSWRYLSTVAYDGITGQESFTEPDIVDLGGGELLAVMRTGHFAPLYSARSLDGGKTWDKPESLHILGLSPQLLLLDSGILVCVAGWRPSKQNSYYLAAIEDYRQRYQIDVGIHDVSTAAGDYVMFSLDKGHTWSKPRRIAEPLTLGFTRAASVERDSFVVISQRLVIPGETPDAVLRRWQQNSAPGLPGWDEWGKRSRRVLEARRITVRASPEKR